MDSKPSAFYYLHNSTWRKRDVTVKKQPFPAIVPNFINRSEKTPLSGASISSFTNAKTSLVFTVVGEQIITKLAFRLGMIFFALFAAHLGCNSTSTNRQMTNEVGEVELREIARGSANISFGKDYALEMEKALKAKQSIVFAHVKWASMGFERKFFCNFANIYRDSHPRDATSFYYVDFTPVAFDSTPLKELNGWSESGGIHGNAELIWILNGEIVSVEPIMNFTLDELVKKTENTFSGQLPFAPRF